MYLSSHYTSYHPNRTWNHRNQTRHFERHHDQLNRHDEGTPSTALKEQRHQTHACNRIRADLVQIILDVQVLRVELERVSGQVRPPAADLDDVLRGFVVARVDAIASILCHTDEYFSSCRFGHEFCSRKYCAVESHCARSLFSERSITIEQWKFNAKRSLEHLREGFFKTKTYAR